MKKAIRLFIFIIFLQSSSFTPALTRCKLGKTCEFSSDGTPPIFVLPISNVAGNYECKIDSSININNVFYVGNVGGIPIDSSSNPPLPEFDHPYLVNHKSISFKIKWEEKAVPSSVWEELTFGFAKPVDWRPAPGSQISITCKKKQPLIF